MAEKARPGKGKRKFTGALLLVGRAADCPDIEYATGFRATDPVVLLDTARGRSLVVPELELGRAARVAQGVNVFTPEKLGLGERARRRLSAWAQALLRREGVRRVVVARSFPLGVARALEQGGVKVDLAKGDLFPQRMVKGADEVRKIAESQQAAVIATRAAVAMIARAEIDGRGYLRNRGTRLTSEDVKRAIAKVLLDHDCVCPDAIVAGGRQGADPHETGSGPLRAGEPIVLDIFPQHTGHGYWGDLTRTVVRGVPSNRVRKMYAAVRAAQSAALSLVRAGARYARVHGGAVEEFKRRGFGPRPAEEKREGFIHSTGHGLGLSIHEAPAVGKADGRLVAGNVITVEPGLYYSDLGGVRIEDTVLVTRTGWQYLVPCEKRFEV